MADNPYIDADLLNAYASYSPAENSKYLQQHGGRNTTTLTENRQINIPPARSTHPSIIPAINTIPPAAQTDSSYASEPYIGVPTGHSDQPPLSYSELSSLSQGDILYILEDDAEDIQGAWSRVTFLSLEPDGFRVQTNVQLSASAFEEIFLPTTCDDDMPVIYKHDSRSQSQSETAGIDALNLNVSNYLLPNITYGPGLEIFVYDRANNFTFYRIIAYDSASHNATLADKSGVVVRLCLQHFRHELVGTESKAIPIAREEHKTNYNTVVTGPYLEMDSLQCNWHWITRTNRHKLKWVSYKNTLHGAIAVSTLHLYPICLDYKAVTLLSNNGLSFHWLDIDVEEEEQDNIIGQHMQLFLGDSTLDSTLQAIAKYSNYTFERHNMPEIVHDAKLGVQRLMQLEQLIVERINHNVCSITNDEYGHLALIVGYCMKNMRDVPPNGQVTPTMYYFKVKKFGAYTQENRKIAENEEYIAVDLYCQQIVITMQAPPKEKQYSFQHRFNPTMWLQLIRDMTQQYEKQLKPNQEEQDIDLYGIQALKQLSFVLSKTKDFEDVPNALAKQTVFALIRLFDARHSMIDVVEWIESKIKNAFHSQTQAEVEWKFDQECDISKELNDIKMSLREEESAIRRQHMIYDEYIRAYDGRPLGIIAWDKIHRAGVKTAIDEIIQQDMKIFENMKQMEEKLAKHLRSQ